MRRALRQSHFLSYQILDRKGLGHAGPLRSAATPVNPPPRGLSPTDGTHSFSVPSTW